MIYPHQGLPAPGHTAGPETLDTSGDLIEAGDTAVEGGRASSNGVMLLTFPSAVRGVIQSDLNYSVVLECLASYITPKPTMHWTFEGKPYDTGKMLIIRSLSSEHLGSYMCIAKNSLGEYASTPVTLSLPQDDVGPTEAEPIEPDPVLSVSGGAAIALLLAANMGGAILIGSVSFTIVQSLRCVLSFTPVCLLMSTQRPQTQSSLCSRCPLSSPETQSSLCSKREAPPIASPTKL
uniref:Ig-like domain-containing protein n=1 Tax=Suricata suricatta TaxID=37032 RepID=A0A673US31_SURSU